MSDNEETYTLSDVLEAEAHWEETTNAVLGGSDNKNCSYSQGYVKRQALYACLTCTPTASPNFAPAGICLACSLKCHDGHELVELYTKRNFRCDCGNTKFPDSPCSLEPRKDDFNELNSYNQNFSGLYCECHRPYPDPDEDEEEDDEMIQCIVCEDWLHGRHTGNDSFDLDSEQAAEFICVACSKKNEFLAYYPHLKLSSVSEQVPAVITAERPSNDDAETVDTDHCTSTGQSGSTGSDTAGDTTSLNKDTLLEAEAGSSQDTRDSGVASRDGSIGDTTEESQTQIEIVAESVIAEQSGPSVVKNEDQQGECRIAAKLLPQKLKSTGCTWWAHGWRSKLCRCINCLELYNSHGVMFLIDPEDTLEFYESKGLKDGISSFDSTQALMQSALSQFDRVAQIEFLHGFNEMKEGLIDFLRKIGDSGRVVTAADIREFFSEMQASKRRRLNDVHIPDNCR